MEANPLVLLQMTRLTEMEQNFKIHSPPVILLKVEQGTNGILHGGQYPDFLDICSKAENTCLKFSPGLYQQHS